MPSLKLLSNERIIHQANPHLLFLLGPLALIVLLGSILLIWICPLWLNLNFASPCRLLFSFLILLSLVVFYLDWQFNRFYLTNFRVITERGIIGKRYTSIWLVKIQDITCQFGIWGRIFGFGDLLIESAGELGQITFKGLPFPLQIQGMIEAEINKIPSSLL